SGFSEVARANSSSCRTLIRRNQTLSGVVVGSKNEATSASAASMISRAVSAICSSLRRLQARSAREQRDQRIHVEPARMTMAADRRCNVFQVRGKETGPAVSLLDERGQLPGPGAVAAVFEREVDRDL